MFIKSFPSGSKRLKSTKYLKNLWLSWPWSCTPRVSRGTSRENALICFWIRAAQCCSAGARLLLKTHPWLVEAKGVLMVLQVLLLPGLLELLPQPPYPVMVTGGNLPAATEQNKSARPRWMWKFSKICLRRSNAGVSMFSLTCFHILAVHVYFFRA